MQIIIELIHHQLNRRNDYDKCTTIHIGSR